MDDETPFSDSDYKDIYDENNIIMEHMKRLSLEYVSVESSLQDVLGYNKVDAIVDAIDEVYGDWKQCMKGEIKPPEYHIKWFIMNLVASLEDKIDFEPSDHRNVLILNNIYGDIKKKT